MINRIINKPHKIKEPKEFVKKMESINNYNKKIFNDVLDKTLREIEKCEKILQNLRNLFVNVIEKNIKYYEIYSNIINNIYDSYYNEIKNLNLSDYSN
jgi:ASC-1-like (ASCH) protein